MIDGIVSKFQNYTYNDSKTLKEYLIDLQNSGNLDTNNLQIQEYLLPDILTIFKKAILSRYATDLLFQYNYWSWGFISLYYSNFFLAQSLNRLKGDFFIRLNNGMKNIQLDSDNQYKLLNTNSSDTHKKEFEKLRENYLFLIPNRNYKLVVPDDYSNRPFFNESKVRNDINYTLDYFKELDNKFTQQIDLNLCKNNYIDNITLSEFKLLEINNKRLEFIFDLLNLVKEQNSNFEIKFNNFTKLLKKQLLYSNKLQPMKHIEKFRFQKKFHIPTNKINKQFKGYL